MGEQVDHTRDQRLVGREREHERVLTVDARRRAHTHRDGGFQGRSDQLDDLLALLTPDPHPQLPGHARDVLG